MRPQEIAVAVDGGHLVCLDYGAPDPSGDVVLLVHGSGHNAAAWNDVASRLARDAHVVAMDLRGHGQSGARSADAEQYWRDIAAVTAALGWRHPVLVGHSTGGYAVTAVAAAGLLEPASVCIIDGFVLDDRVTAARNQAAMTTPQALAQLREHLDYGWHGSEAAMEAAVDRAVRERAHDWLNAGSGAELVRAVAERSYVQSPADKAPIGSLAEPVEAGPEWLRRPTLTEIATVAAADPAADIYPSVDIYRRLTCPLMAVLPSKGFYADRRDTIVDIVNARPERTLIDIDGGHNVVMTAPNTVSTVLIELLHAASPESQ